MLESPLYHKPNQSHRADSRRSSTALSDSTQQQKTSPSSRGPAATNNNKSRPPRTTPKRWATAQQHAAPGAGSTSASASAQRHQHQQHDQHSVGNQSSTPSSVLVHRIPLTRDLSDLSGSYAGRTCVSGASSTILQPRQHPLGESGAGYNGASSSRPKSSASSSPLLAVPKEWTQARILSPREPHHPQPQSSGDSVSIAVRRRGTAPPGSGKDAPVTKPFLVVESAAVELIENMDVGNDPRRIPLIVLLMDPARKLYELAQLWVDQVEDSVRDVLHAIQNNLRDKQNWKTDYDGLFQYRNQSYSQLIHILDVNRYDAQPYELWIAKPWSMSAKATIGHAAGAIQHLRRINVLKQESSAANNHRGGSNGLAALGLGNSSAAVIHGGESLLVLSPEARSRIYAPGGVLKHYHACQFLSFSPSLEAQLAVPTKTIRVDVLGTDAYSEDGCSQLSDSHYYAASVSHGDGGGEASGVFSVESSSSSNRALLSGSQACSGPSTLPSTPSLKRTLARNHHVTTNSKSNQISPSVKAESRKNFQSHKSMDLELQKSSSSSTSHRAGNAWSLLNCAACKREAPEDSKTIIEPTLLDATTVGPMVVGGPTWRAAWEEELSVVNSVSPSVHSERAPLLQNLGPSGSRGWRFEI